jgi:hypothetical protein
MSAHLRRVLADLKHDTSSVELAPPTRIRARGEAWRRHRITGGAVAAVVAAVVATVFAVAAVGGRSTTSPPLVPASPTTSAETDCGRHVLYHAERLPDTAIACFLNAVAAGRSAYLAETRHTIEGDPIHMLYDADATGAVEVVQDTRADAFGPREVTRQTCTGPFDYNGHIGFTECSSPVPVGRRTSAPSAGS